MIAKMPTIAAMAYKYSIGQPFMVPRNDLDYASNFLYMMFGVPCEACKVNPVLEPRDGPHLHPSCRSRAEHLGFDGAARRILRSQSLRLHCGGHRLPLGPGPWRRQRSRLKMLMEIGTPDRIPLYIKRAKDKKDKFRLAGFGHRVYKTYDPRARIMKEICKEVLEVTGVKNDPIFEVAQELERIALQDDYFIEKKLFPNIDF